MDSKRTKIYYSPGVYWKGIAAIKKLSEAAKVPEETAKKWPVTQAIWQIYLPTPRRIPRPKFDVPTPNAVHQADLLFDKLPRGHKVYKYVLTVTDVTSAYKEAEPITCAGLPEDLQVIASHVAKNAAGRPRAQIHGGCYKRNGKPKDIQLLWVHRNSLRPDYC